RRLLRILTLPVLMLAQEKTPPMVNGRPISEEEKSAIMSLAGPELGPVISRNPEELLRFYGLIDRLAEIAEKEKIADESPVKEQLQLALTLQRKKVLADALAQQYVTRHPVTAEDEKKYYAAHLGDYTVAHVQGLCVPIATEKESGAAKAKADELAAQLAKGAGFAALAAKYPVP